MDELPSVDRGPRQSDPVSQTGTGSPRSADLGTGEGPLPDAMDELNVNRSGSGGSGGPSTPETNSEGSSAQSMEELLGNDDPSSPA